MMRHNVTFTGDEKGALDTSPYNDDIIWPSIEECEEGFGLPVAGGFVTTAYVPLRSITKPICKNAYRELSVIYPKLFPDMTGSTTELMEDLLISKYLLTN